MKRCALFAYVKRALLATGLVVSTSTSLADASATASTNPPNNTPTNVRGMDTLSWHGYVSQGLIYTTENNFFGESQNTSFEMTNIALGATWRPWSRLQFSAQGLYRQAGATSRDDVYTDYALADLTLIQDMSWQLGMRAGRIKNPVGLYNDTRDIAASRPSILLPESIYRDSLRDIFHTSDSVSLYSYGYLGDTFVQLDLLKGKPQITKVTETSIIPSPFQGELEDEETEIARILLEAFGGNLRLGYTYVYFEVDYEPNPGTTTVALPPLFIPITVPVNGYLGNTENRFGIWSAEYNLDRWQFTSEYYHSDLYVNGIIAPGIKVKTSGEGYYLSASYQFDSRWRGFARYDVSYTDKDDKDGDDYEAQTGSPGFRRFAKDMTIGLRFEPNKHWLFAAEFHHIRGTAWTADIENDINDQKEHWNLFTAEVSYKF